MESITIGSPHAQRTKPAATSVVKRATEKKSTSLNSTARKVKTINRPDASQQPETNSMHLNMPERQKARTLTNITFDSLEYSSLTGEELFAPVRI